MRKLIKTFYLFVFILFLTGINVNADTYPNTSIAIVDLNLILSESKAAKAATKDFEKIQQETESKIVETDKSMLEERNKLI